MKVIVNKAIVKKRGVFFTLIISEEEIPIEILCKEFGANTIKVTKTGIGQFNFEGLYDIENIFDTVEDISSFSWEESKIEI